MCAQLGYDNGYSDDHMVVFGGDKPSGPIHLYDVTCNGQESRVAYCNWNWEVPPSCNHGDDLAVDCWDDSDNDYLIPTTEAH